MMEENGVSAHDRLNKALDEYEQAATSETHLHETFDLVMSSMREKQQIAVQDLKAR